MYIFVYFVYFTVEKRRLGGWQRDAQWRNGDSNAALRAAALYCGEKAQDTWHAERASLEMRRLGVRASSSV